MTGQTLQSKSTERDLRKSRNKERLKTDVTGSNEAQKLLNDKSSKGKSNQEQCDIKKEILIHDISTDIDRESLFNI